jgi:KEOPS complex subunit Cgi121
MNEALPVGGPVAILGFRGPSPRVADIPAILAKARAEGCEAQFLRADRVAGPDHLRSAILHAERAFREGRNVSEQWGTEVLRYAAGARQIGKALRFLGLEEGVTSIACVARGRVDVLETIAQGLGWVRDDGVVAAKDEALRAWGLSDAERGTLRGAAGRDWILERVALADLEK